MISNWERNLETAKCLGKRNIVAKMADGVLATIEKSVVNSAVSQLLSLDFENCLVTNRRQNFAGFLQTF